MNIVYFLNPLPLYIRETNHVLKPGGPITFGCKFSFLPKGNNEFVYFQMGPIVESTEKAGFDVVTIDIKVDGGEDPMKNYLKIQGRKKN